MKARPLRSVAHGQSDAASTFYRDVLTEMGGTDFPALIGGTYAFAHYAGYERPTKDLDLFVEPEQVKCLLAHFSTLGFDTQLTFPHWLGKIKRGPHSCDVIFSSGNGIARVDKEWFTHSVPHQVLGIPVRLTPPEEMVWSKAFVQERERYDGGDVIHLIYQQGASLDWARLLQRFGPHWRVLLSFIILFGFVYPSARDRVPAAVVNELLARFEMEGPEPVNWTCNGALLSREQYLTDLDSGMVDPRLAPFGRMTAQELRCWTDAIGETK